MPKRHKTWQPPGLQPRHNRRRQARPNANARGYGRQWRNAARRYLAAHPLCVQCEEAGHTVAAELVDHILPAASHPKLFWDAENWQGLCRDCHAVKTGKGQ